MYGVILVSGGVLASRVRGAKKRTLVRIFQGHWPITEVDLHLDHVLEHVIFLRLREAKTAGCRIWDFLKRRIGLLGGLGQTLNSPGFWLFCILQCLFVRGPNSLPVSETAWVTFPDADLLSLMRSQVLVIPNPRVAHVSGAKHGLHHRPAGEKRLE